VHSHRFDVGTMLWVFELNVKNPAFAKQKNSSNAKGFYLKNYQNQITVPWSSTLCLQVLVCTPYA